MRLYEVYNIPRNKMPQINRKHLDNYEQKLMVVDINSVTPSQSDRVPGMVDKTLSAFKRGEKELLDKPMVVDRDMNIVNGHHRYDALKKMGMTKVPVLKVDATLPELIDDFKHTTSDRPVVDASNLEESFNQPYPVKLNKSEDGDYDALVKLPDGTNMDILFTNHGGIWDMEFHRGNSQDVTGEGDAYRIFATMLSAVKQFIRTEKPRIVSFQATKDVDPNDANPESRAKLYSRMVDKFANGLGYNASMDDYGDTVEYELVAKQGVGEGNKAQKGIPANATDAELRSAIKAGGAKGKRAHWLLNMRKGNRKRRK